MPDVSPILNLARRSLLHVPATPGRERLLFREHKFGGENGPRPELGKDDFLLKHQVVELFSLFNKIGNGVVAALEIQRGLPSRATFEEPAA
jgi:hypothetical protein